MLGFRSLLDVLEVGQDGDNSICFQVPPAQEAEVEGLLVPRSARSAWAA